MNNQVLKYRKTSHFKYRQWDRSFDDRALKVILSRIRKNIEGKTHLIISNELLRKNSKTRSKKENLIIVVKKNVLITLFFVDDLYNYLKTVNALNSLIIS